MNQGPAPELTVFLCDEESAGRIRVEIDAFVQFSAEMDRGLVELEERWRACYPPTPAVSRGPGKRSRNRQGNGEAQSSGG